MKKKLDKGSTERPKSGDGQGGEGENCVEGLLGAFQRTRGLLLPAELHFSVDPSKLSAKELKALKSFAAAHAVRSTLVLKCASPLPTTDQPVPLPRPSPTPTPRVPPVPVPKKAPSKLPPKKK